jgi:hypothetical protein
MRVVAAGYRRVRPDVHRGATARWTNANREQARAACRSHYARNKEYYATKNRAWAKANPDKPAQYERAYNARNPARRRAGWLAFYYRNKDRPLYVIRRRVTSRMHAYLAGRRSGFMHMIGCTACALKSHLELLFSAGMGWQNADQWEIDHFYPLSAIGDDPDWLSVAAVCNYRNLRPVWRSANRSKRAFVLPEAEQLFQAVRQLVAVGKA